MKEQKEVTKPIEKREKRKIGTDKRNQFVLICFLVQHRTS